MNSFGRIFRIHIFGESHGECVGITIDGCPAGLPLNPSDFVEDIERRKGGVQKGTTPRKEDDIPLIKTGVFNGHTTGAPITIFFENNNTRSGDYDDIIRIMKSKRMYQDRVMPILYLMQNSEDFRIIGEEDIIVAD